ncbi:putative nuclease HARBI1 [Cucumis melo var. makuwa]|uniref:Putative nuclease HARBI1 n=1 Tax=Cucumis melo var. makuwa TaxID=1194695 RepID=A0A5D3BUZ9_CUCMM|nr:putative nuclease HARBI1 [Cucumis melo var. makuwa]
MDRRCFAILCHLLIIRTSSGSTSTKIVNVEKMIAMFLYVLAYDVKNREIQQEFMRSAHERSRYRTGKGDVAINVLGVFDTKGNFDFVLVRIGRQSFEESPTTPYKSNVERY